MALEMGDDLYRHVQMRIEPDPKSESARRAQLLQRERATEAFVGQDFPAVAVPQNRATHARMRPRVLRRVVLNLHSSPEPRDAPAFVNSELRSRPFQGVHSSTRSSRI